MSNKFISIQPESLVFKYDDENKHYISTMNIENISNKNTITKIYINSPENFSTSHSIIFLKSKDNRNIIFNRRLTNNDEPSDRSNVKICLKTVPVDDDTFFSNDELKKKFKEFTPETIKEIGQEIKVDINGNFDIKKNDDSLNMNNIKKKLNVNETIGKDKTPDDNLKSTKNGENITNKPNKEDNLPKKFNSFNISILLAASFLIIIIAFLLKH